MPPSRIDELRRRVQNDPASIAFAQLAEEYRRAGQTDEAVRICREGLTRHPGYLSARVTLGRALLDLGELAEARGEFEFVVAEAPENLAAVRGLAEISHREGQTAEALTYYERALALSRHDPEIEEIVQQLSRQVGASASGDTHGLSFEEAHQELLSAAERVPLARPAVPLAPPEASEGSTAPFDFDRLVAALGSPSAPPQFEAAVDGSAAAAPISLPESIDLGPNPFAALEAELRAAEAVPQGGGQARPWDSPGVPAPEDGEVAGGSGPIVDRPGEPVGEAGAAAPGPEATGTAGANVEPAWSSATDAFGLSDAGAGEPFDLAAVPVDDTVPSVIDELLAAAAQPEEPSAASALLVDLGETPATPAQAEPAAPAADGQAPGPAAAPGDDVLGDLETWLNTLQNRASE